MQSTKSGFLKGWLTYNFIGWVIGGVVSIGTILATSRLAGGIINFAPLYGVSLSGDAEAELTVYLFWLPLSVFAALFQWLNLRHLNVSGPAWILGTTLAWVVPAASLPVLLDHSALALEGFASWDTGGWAATVTTMVVCVAIAQAMILRSSRRASVLWIVAHLAGSFACLLLVLITLLIGHGIGHSLKPYFFSLGEIGKQIVWKRLELSIALVYLVLPLWATLTVGLPTGLILSKYRLRQESDESAASVQPSMA